MAFLLCTVSVQCWCLTSIEGRLSSRLQCWQERSAVLQCRGALGVVCWLGCHLGSAQHASLLHLLTQRYVAGGGVAMAAVGACACTECAAGLGR